MRRACDPRPPRVYFLVTLRPDRRDIPEVLERCSNLRELRHALTEHLANHPRGIIVFEVDEAAHTCARVPLYRLGSS